MSKFRIVLASFALLAAQQVFAADASTNIPAAPSDSDPKPCLAIAQACKAAGFSRRAHGRGFWKNCMRPVLHGQPVKGVNVDPTTVKMCREGKIKKLTQELKDLQAARQNNS